MSERITTAAYLVALNNELLEGGIDSETRAKIVVNAALNLIEGDGLAVRNA